MKTLPTVATMLLIAMQAVVFLCVWSAMVMIARSYNRFPPELSFGLTVYYGTMWLIGLFIVCGMVALRTSRTVVIWSTILAGMIAWLAWLWPSFDTRPFAMPSFFVLGAIILIVGTGCGVPLCKRLTVRESNGDQDSGGISASRCVRVVEYNKVIFDEDGFQYPGEETSRVHWHGILRVAIGYEIHPLVVVDWDFVAFQCQKEDITYWVQAVPGDAFTSEVRRRFGAPNIPPMEDWADSEFCIRTYTVWPLTEIGKPMFRNVKRHRWSLRSGLAYTEVERDPIFPSVSREDNLGRKI